MTIGRPKFCIQLKLSSGLMAELFRVYKPYIFGKIYHVQKRSPNFLYPFLFSLFLAAGVLIGMFLSPSGPVSFQKNKGRINEVLNIIDGYYVDTIDESVLEEEAIAELLKNLDPHSVFIPSRDLQTVNEPLDGQFEGIGVEFSLLNDTIYIVNVIDGGPSQRAGLMSGDRIVKVEDTLVAGVGIQNDDVISKLKGPAGTKVNVSVRRGLSKELLDYTIKRGTIPVKSVDAHYMMDNGVGYIKLLRFSQTTSHEVRASLEDLNERGMKNLILDLRGNPGGYLSAAIDVADEFLDGDKLIVYTEGRTHPKKSYFAESRGRFETGKLVVLVDEQSASASEIVSGAVQDWDRGLVVGRRSYGKGLVQESIPLSDQSVIRLTISRYYTPTGRSIQKPYEDGYDKYQMEVYDRWEHGEMEYADSVQSIDSLRFVTPKGRSVYGGGGIYPDIFVPIDTSFDRALVSAISRRSLHRRYVYAYADYHRKQLERYKTPNAFIKSFHWNSKDVQDFLDLCASDSLTVDPESWAISKAYMLTEMKAILGRQLFDNNVYYQVSNSNDNAIKAALTGLENYQAKLMAGVHLH